MSDASWRYLLVRRQSGRHGTSVRSGTSSEKGIWSPAATVAGEPLARFG